jgi:hypothetical protein
MNLNHFHVIAVGLYNPWINECIESILSQSFPDFSLTIVIDPGENNTHNYKLDIRGNDFSRHEVNIVYNQERKYRLKNQDLIIYNREISDASIIVLVDLDDTLAARNVLSRINCIYEAYSPVLTYGGMVKHFNPDKIPGLYDYSWKDEITITDTQKCREKIGRTEPHHLLTFRKWLYMKINPEDLRDENGKFFTACTDRAIQYPMIEMAGTKNIYHTQFPTYIYNNANPLNVWRVNKSEQEKACNYIKNKKPYAPLEESLSIP